MAADAVAQVRVVSVHVGCNLCGRTAVIDLTATDDFTEHVLVPYGAWCITHLGPRVDGFDLLTNGVPSFWELAG